MNNHLLNLIDFHFQDSYLFKHLPVFDEIYYLGQKEGNVQLFQAIREDQKCTILSLTMIRQEEDFLWQSAGDLLERTVIEAASKVHGVFTFELLTFDIHKEVKTFNFMELVHLIVNHSRKVNLGRQRMIKYSSLYGILQKLLDETWGKITLKTSVEVFKNRPEQLDTVIRKLFHLAGLPHGPLILFINDLSSEPLFNPQNKIQQDLLYAAIARQTEKMIGSLPEVYIQDKNGLRELLSRSVVK